MTPKTKTDYAEMGQKDAQASRRRGALVAEAFSRDAKSWQARAYWEGYDNEIERLKSSAVLQSARAHAARSAPQRIAETTRRAFGFGISVQGPLYPARIKGRSRRGWTEARA